MEGRRGAQAAHDRPQPPTGRALARRAAALAGALVAGVVIGIVVERLAGTAWGYVAVPLAIVVLWWRLADPTQCAADASRPHPPRDANR